MMHHPQFGPTASTHPHLYVGAVLGQLRRCHLKQLAHLSSTQVTIIMKWDLPHAPFHIPSVALPSLRAALSDVSRTTPQWDLIQYPISSLRIDDHLWILICFYNGLLLGYKRDALHFGDFTLLPKKSPHGVSHLSVP